MKLTGESRFLLSLLGITAVVVAAAVFWFSQPVAPLTRADLLPDGRFTQGNPQASVYLVEFADFQCPACKAAKPVVDGLVSQHKSKLVYIYRHFPLEQHSFAVKAAIAVEAAGGQGKFWEMYNLLFENQDKLSDDLILSFAKQLKLDQTKFKTALESPIAKDTVVSDRAFGIKIGVNATPTFFLNGQKLELASWDDLKQKVEAAVSK